MFTIHIVDVVMSAPDKDKPCPKGTKFLGDKFPTVDAFSSTCMRAIAKATAASNAAIPSDRAEDWDFYTTFKDFRQIMTRETADLSATMNEILKFQSIKGQVPGNVPDMLELLTEANDQILEKINTHLDEAEGIRKEADPLLMAVAKQQEALKASTNISGSWNKRNSSSATPDKLNVKLLTARNVSRPQIKFKDLVDNSTKTVFIPRLKDKPFSKKPLSILPEYDDLGKEFYSHPYLYELDLLKHSDKDLAKADPGVAVPLDEAKFAFIDTEPQLLNMIDTLKNEGVIAIDLEHHSYRSFQGITSLIQISSFTQDFLIDPFPLWRELTVLNEITANPKIIKVLHGADKDILWLQRDFSVYVVNLFDTHVAAKSLNFPPGCRSLAYLLHHYCKVATNKQFQLADWRIRPLTEDMMTYARTDTR